MRNILIITHGLFASGIKNSLDVVAGQSENVTSICVSANDSPEEIKERIEAYIKRKSGAPEDEIIIFTDIPGGSTTTNAFEFASTEKNIFLVTGLNLGMLLEVFLAAEDSPAEEILKNAVESSKETIMLINSRFDL